MTLSELFLMFTYGLTLFNTVLILCLFFRK